MVRSLGASTSGSGHGGGKDEQSPPKKPKQEGAKTGGRKRNVDEDQPMEEASQPVRGDGKGSDPKVKLHKEKTAKVLKLMIKSLLRNMQDIRDLQSCVVDVFLGEDSSVEFLRMKEQTKHYSELDQEAKNKNGPPHLLAFVGLLEGLISRGDAVGQANAVAIKRYHEQVQAMEWEELAEQVRMCRAMKTFKEGQKKLLLEVSRTPIRKELLLALRQVNFNHKQGRPPPTFMERELAEWLQYL